MVLTRGASVAAEWRARPAVALAATLLLASLLAPSSASAHERFIKHRLKVPLHDEFFLQGPGPMGIHPDLVRIATTVFVILVALMLLWYLRQPLEEIVQRRIVRRLGAPAQRIVH